MFASKLWLAEVFKPYSTIFLQSNTLELLKVQNLAAFFWERYQNRAVRIVCPSSNPLCRWQVGRLRTIRSKGALSVKFFWWIDFFFFFFFFFFTFVPLYFTYFSYISAIINVGNFFNFFWLLVIIHLHPFFRCTFFGLGKIQMTTLSEIEGDQSL